MVLPPSGRRARAAFFAVRRRARLGRAGAGWLGLLCVLGAAYVWILAGGPRAVMAAAAVATVVATIALGGRLGYQRDWPRLGQAVLAGTLVLVCWAEIVWIASFFLPVPGGSGGMLEILAPAFLAVVAGLLGLAALATILGAGALLGWALGSLRHSADRQGGRAGLRP
jgi:hypothetical protein